LESVLTYLIIRKDGTFVLMYGRLRRRAVERIIADCEKTGADPIAWLIAKHGFEEWDQPELIKL